MRCTGAAALQGGQLGGRAAAQESKVCGRGAVEPPAASTERAAGSFGAASDCKLCSSRFEQFGPRPFEARPALEGGLRMPGERWDAGRGSPDSVRGLCQGVRCGAARAARPHASIAGSGATQPQIPPKALGPARAALARRRAPHSPPPVDRAPPATRDDDQGPAAAQACPHHNMHNSLPRRPRQRRSVLRPRRVCRARFQGNR